VGLTRQAGKRERRKENGCRTKKVLGKVERSMAKVDGEKKRRADKND